ncbi:hypothetical protein OBBRIDRAFT_791129 [Obba rivulosa]|uniref:GH16 domain-containing protein n=1 Tax=Obba rivulosa TaxID=1052685 RepID=A0A8E2DMS4_9APHY|nr:hypothetical protein OBBRIDRAFT_791129 [Obba rivulosa]
MKIALSALSALTLQSQLVWGVYNLVREYSGQNFFTGWDFYGNYDNLTNGDAIWVNQSLASTDHLAFVNDAGHAIIKVDNTSFVPYNDKRDSVRVTTEDFFPVGSLFIIDLVHLPYGCSVWPSFWTKGPNWPIGGEIDIVEGVNQMTFNQMALHTQDGCTASPPSDQISTTTLTNCSAVAGCTVAEKQPNSFGAGFDSAGGGVWATQFDVTGIYIWFWTRSSVPSTVNSSATAVDPSTWGPPTAAYPSSTCNITNFFTEQQLVLDITLCGDWAGEPSVYQETCPASAPANASSCYLENVINNGTSAYANAYFEISYIKAFNVDSTIVGPSGTVSVSPASATAEPPAASSSSGSSSASGSGSNSGSNSSNAASAWGPTLVPTILAAALGVSALLAIYEPDYVVSS